jgi:ribosomal protein S18 acetylase RimI-like enzyme
MSQKAPVQIRPAIAEDAPFIFNSWLKSYRSSHFARYIVNTVYFTEHHKIIEKLIKENKVLVACNPEDPTQLYGYICAGTVEGFFVCHYIYVKHTYRNMGIGKALLNSFEHDPSVAGIYSHHTRIADRLAPRYNLVFHPYIMFNVEDAPNDNEA